MIILSWIACIAIARLVEECWWAPGALLSLVLGGNALATMLFAPEYYMSISANLVLEGFVFVVLFGSLLGRGLSRSNRKDFAGSSLIVTRMSGFIAFGIFVSLIFLYAVASSHGVGLGVLSDPSALLRVAQDSTRERYLESVQVPLYGSLASAGVLAYTTVLVMHATVGGKVRLLNVVPLAIFVLSNLLVTTRSSLVYLILVSLLAYAFAYSCANRRYPPMFNFKTVLLILGALVSLSGIFLAFQMVRFGASHSRSVWEVLGYLRRWPWGSIPSFSLWWNGDAPIEVGHLPGYYTFMGIYDNLGIDSRTQGGFSGFVYLTADEPGNVYTAFRGLVEDFGLVGGGVFLAMLGFVAGQAYRGTTLSPSVRMMVFFLTYMWLVTSFIVSYWAFAGNIFAAFLVPLLVNLFCQVDVVAGKGLKVE